MIRSNRSNNKWQLICWFLINWLIFEAYSESISECSPSCDTHQGLHWLPINYTSVFKYETYTRFRSIRLAAPSQSSLQLKAELLITRLNTCQYELRLRNVNSSIWTADQTTALTSLPIRFGLSFGRVQQVCASDTDPDWSLNIKRALVSNLQLYWPPPDIRSNRTGIVRLVHGECPFEYQLLTSDATTRRVRLQVPLQQCHHRLATVGSIQVHGQSGHFRFRSGLLAQDDYLKCELILNDTQLEQVDCLETASITPLLGSQLSSDVIVRSQFQLISEPKSADIELATSSNFNQITGILFQPIQQSSQYNSVAEVINQIENRPSEHILETKRFLRRLPGSVLCELIVKSKNDTNAHQFLLSQMLQLGTAESFICAVQLIQRDSLSVSDLHRLYSAIQWSSEPTDLGLKSLQELHWMLQSQLSWSEMRILLLAISGYTRNLLRSVSITESIHDSIVRLASQWIDTLTLTCDQESDASVLKALVAMADHLNVEHQQRLLLCFVNATSVEQQILTLDVMLSNHEAQSLDLDQLFVQIFADDQYDLEIRLAIFHRLIRQTRYQDMLFEVTKQSQDKQLSSYVWSFVDNELKSLPWFRRIEFVKRARFSADQVASLLSHSKNIVWQRKLGPIAARVAVDVIRSNDLQVRTVKVVTEMALQGKRIDLLEITLRQSGLNQMMQHLLVNTLTSKLTWNELFDRVSDLDTDPNVIQMIRQRAESLLRHLPLDQIQFTFNLKWNDNDLVYMRSYSNQSNRFNMGDWKTIFQQFRQNTAQNYLDQNHQLSLSNGFSLILSLNGMVQNVHRFDPNQQFIQKLEHSLQVQVGVLAASTFGGFLVRNEIGAKLQAQLQLNPSHNGWKIKLKPLQGQLILAREESRSFFVSFHNQTGQEIRLPDVFRANAPIEPCLHDKKMLGKWLLRWTGLVCCATVEREGERFQWQRPNFLFNQQTRTQLSCTSNEPKDRSWTIEWHRKSNQLYFKYDYPESTLPRMIEFKVRHKSDSNQSIVVVVGQMADTSMRFDILYQNPIDSNQRKWNLNFQWNQLQIESIYTDQFRRHLNKSEYRPEFKVFASSTSKPTSDLDQLLPSISNASNAIIDWSGSFGIDRDRKTVLSAYMMDRLENSKIWRSFVSIDKSIGRKVTIELQSWKRPLPIGHLTLEFDAQRKHTSLDVQIAYGRNHSRHAKFMIKVHDLSMNQLKRLGGFVQVQSTDCLRCNVLLTASLMHRPGSYVEHELNFHWPYSIELRNHSVTLTTPHRHRYGIRHVGQYLPTSTVDPNHFHLLHRLTLRFGQWTKNGQFAVLWLPGQLPHIRFLVEFGDELQLQAGRKNVLSSNHSSMDTISASTRNSVDDLLRAANESMQSGNILLLGEYHQSSVKPQRNSIVALLQLQSVAFVRFVDQLREWPINFYDGQMSLYWAPDQSRFARLQYTLHSQQNYGRTEHELHSQLFSSMWAGRLKHTAKLQMHRNQLQLQSTALISLQPIWSVSFNALRGNSSGHRVRSDQVQLNVDSGLGKIRLDTSLAPIKQTIRLHMISGRIEHRSDVSFDWIDRDWQTSMKTTFQQESLLSWHSRLAPGREHAIRFNCSRGFATLQVLQQPILSGKVQLNWPSKNFRHYTAWTAPENELLLSSETRRAENVLLAMQVNSGRKGTASVEWSGQLIRAHWNEIKARTHYEWTGSYVKDGQVWHQGQAQLAATQLQSNFTSITLNGSRWMNVSTVLNAQDISWVSIELPESKHRFSANPFVVEPFFELQRYRHRLQDRLHLKYVIGRDQERYFSAIRDWPTIDRQQKQLFQIGWAGRVQQFHVQHLNQWIRVEANRKMKGFDVQLRLWNERVMRQEIMLQRNETFLSGKFCTWIGERPIIKANLNHETNRKGQASIGSRWMNGTTFYELVQGQVVNGSCSIQTMHITHQTNFTQTSELMSLHTLTTSGDLPIALVRVDVDYHNESVFQAEIPMAKIHGRISPKGARRQLWFELQRLLGQQQLGRLVFNVKSADGMASVRSEWSPQTSNTTKLLLFALLDPVKTSRLIFNAGSIHSSLLFHLPNATHEGVGLLKAEHVIQEWSHEMHLRLPTFRQWHFKGHCKQGPVTLIHLNRLSLVLSDRWRPNVLLEAEISGQITAPSIRPIIGSNLTMNLNLTNDPQFTYTGRFLGNHFQVDALISDQYKSIVSGRLFDNRLNASFDWFVQPKLGNVQIDWNRFRHQTHFKVHGNHTLNINSNTIDANDRQLLDLVGLLSVSNSSLIHVNSPMFRLDSALHPYQEIKNFTLAYDNFSMNQTHRSIVEFAFQRFLHIHSLGERQQQKWYELRLNGSRREGGWLHYERDCCTRLNANYTITKDRRDLIARFDKDQVQRRLTAAIFREQSDEQENTKSKHSLFNMFSNRFAKPNVAESNGSERKLMPKLGGNKFGAKKLTTTDGPNAANLMYVVERDGEVETKIQLWAPAFKASGGQLESRVYSGTIDFNAIERRLAMHLRNQESGHDERWIAFYESWLACHFEVTRTAKDAIIYSYVWLLSPDRQRLLMIKSPRHLEIDASVMGNQSHGPSGRFVYENSVEKHRLRSEVNVNDLTSGHLQSETRWRDQLWYDLDLLVNTNPALPSTPKASYAARLRLLAPIWRFEHWSEVKLGQQFVLNSDTKRNEKRVFWLQSTLHRHQIQWFDLDGDIETNDLLDVQVHLKSKNETIHFSKIKFDGLKLIARSSHRPAGRSLYDLDLSGSGIEVSHLKVNTSRHDLSLEGAWLEWHKLAHVQYRSPTRYLAQHVELISIEDSGTLTKTIQGRLYSDWLDDRYVNGSLSIANQAVNAHVQLHPLLEQWLFGQAQLAVIRSDRHNLLQILFIKNNQTLETEAAALFDEEGGRPRSVKVRLNSTQESIPAFELQSQRNTTNDCVTINGSFRLNTIQCKLNGELNPSHVPVEIMLQQHENSDLKRLLHVKHRSTDKHLDTLAILRLTNQQYGFSVENNSNQTIDDGSHPIQIDVHVRNHTSRLIWTKTSHSASGQLYPNAADPNDVYLIQVKSNGSSELNLLNASYEIDHPKLLRTQSIDLRLSDYRRQGNLTFDLLPNENQKLQIEYQIINEFGMYAGRVWIRDHLIQKFDVETQLSIVRHNPLAGSSFRWRWLTSSGERLHGRYQVQWRGPEFLIVDDPTNRIELSGSIDTIDLGHNASAWLEPSGDRSLLRKPITLDQSQVRVHQMRVNERAIQLRSGRVKSMVHCWIVALFDRHSPNVQQRLCFDQSLAEDVARLQAEQWMAGLLQSKSTVTWSLTDSGLQVLARYDLNQWTHVWHSIQDLAAGVRLNRYNWTLVENELHAKRNYCIEVFRLALDSNLVDKLQQSIDQLQLPIIIKQTSRTMVARWNEWWQNRINYRWISNRLQTIRVWAQNWLQWMDQIARHFIQTINQYNGNVFEMLHDMRRKYLLQVQRALDRLVLNALDWCAQALSNVQSWLMHKSLPIVQNQLNSLVVRLHAEVKRQQAAVVEHEFDYTRKVLHILSAIMPSRAWFEAPNELTWRPDRGEFTLVIRTNST